MLVQNSVYRNTYLTDGINKDFYFSFPILESSQVLVQTSPPTDTSVPTTVDPGLYTVIGVGLPTGGHVSFTTAPAAGARLALTLDIPITQLYQYAELDSFPAKSHENALAKLTLICQQLREQINRAVVISATSEGTSADLVNSIFEARDAAQASASVASTSASVASTSASVASTSASAAEQSAITAAANSAGLITEVQNLSAMYVGKIFAIPATDTYVPNGCAPANGAEYTATQFPTLYNDYLVGGKLLTCTYTAFADQVALTGNCAKFALDTAAQKFKVPLLKDGDSITQSLSASELGKSYKAALPNAKGKLGNQYNASSGFVNDPTSALYSEDFTGAGTNTAAANNLSGLRLDLSRSSSVYKDGVTTVLDEQVRLRHFVVIASAQNNQSVFDWSAYMSALAGKANADLSNVVLQPSMAGSATLNGTANNTVQLTGIVTKLGLEVGDVIRIQYSGYDKSHTVESITDDNSIIVNYEHAGNRANGSLKLPNTTASVTITRIAKWYNAPVGLGQAWVSVLNLRSQGTTYTNKTGRMIIATIVSSGGSGVNTYASVDGAYFRNGVSGGVSSAQMGVTLVIPNESTYVGANLNTLYSWLELR